MAGAAAVGAALAERLGVRPAQIGRSETPLGVGWDVELAAALPALRLLSQHLEDAFAAGVTPVTALNRCASALATLPVAARHRPDAAVVWFDAHADSNLPSTSASGYLGGMVLTGAAGHWATGMGDDLDLANVVLVGARDIDPAEQALIDAGALKHVPVGPGLTERLRAAVAGRAVYVHLDCDVLNPGLVPTEYRVENGLSFENLSQTCNILAACEVIGFEIAEFEDRWVETSVVESPARLLEALEPLLKKISGEAPQTHCHSRA